MSDLTRYLAIVLAINVMLWLGQAAILNMNPEGGRFYNCEGSLLSSFEEQGCSGTTYNLDDTDPGSRIPGAESSVSPSTGNIFTDIFTAARSWVLDATGIRYVLQILGAPSNFLKMIGLPDVFTFAVGALWYGLTLFLIISWLFGKET